MQSFRDLNVWQKAHSFTLAIYKISSKFPKEEMYGLTSQIRRSAYSVPMNLAEGSARQTDPDSLRFFVISFSSTQETEYTLLLCKDLGFINDSEYLELDKSIIEIKSMLGGLIKTVKTRIK